MLQAKLDAGMFKRPTSREDCISYVGDFIGFLEVSCAQGRSAYSGISGDFRLSTFAGMNVCALLGSEENDFKFDSYVVLKATMQQMFEACELVHAFMIRAFTGIKEDANNLEHRFILDFGATRLFTFILNVLVGEDKPELLIYRIMSATFDFNGRADQSSEYFDENMDMASEERTRAEAIEFVRRNPYSSNLQFKVINARVMYEAYGKGLLASYRQR